MNVLDLPQDCLSHIPSLTPPKDVVRSSTVSKQFLSVSTLDTVCDKFTLCANRQKVNDKLPEDCLTYILSLTSPRDVARSSAVSKQFLSVSTLDSVWDKFLPSDIDDIISKSSSVISLASKKEIFMYLCDFPILLENNTKSFALEKKRSGKICYMLGSRALSIVWGSSPQYWRWESIYGSRFPECAVLIDVCWLEIHGKIHTSLLSQGTPYGVYFVYRIKDGSFTGFEETLVKGSVSVTSEDGLPILGDQRSIEINSFYLDASSLNGEMESGCTVCYNNVRFVESEEEDGEMFQDKWSEEEDTGASRGELLVTREESEEEYSSRELLVAQDEKREKEDGEEDEEYSLWEILANLHVENEEEDEEEDEVEPLGELPVARDDWWMEIELGRYQVGVNDGDERVVLEMSLKEVENLNWKNGLVVHGIEIRPLS